ncbi:hypothetical protein KAH37_06410 [bacterium]|nr:hypothetical protein [bacterium]
MTTKIVILLFFMLIFSACSTSPEGHIKDIDFDKIAQSVKENDPKKVDALLANEIETVGKLCESLKASKIEMRHLALLDPYSRQDFMMNLGGFYKLKNMIKNGTINQISDKDREDIKYICNKLVFDAESTLNKK